jgi:Flp pilus assembly pilin Flp
MHLVANLLSSFMHFLRKEDGISFIECALIASLVAVVGGIALLALGKRL